MRPRPYRGGERPRLAHLGARRTGAAWQWVRGWRCHEAHPAAPGLFARETIAGAGAWAKQALSPLAVSLLSISAAYLAMLSIALLQCGRFHTLIISAEREMREQDLEQLTYMLQDRLGVREEEQEAAVERYRTSTGKKRRRRRVVNKVGQEEYISDTETEQSELDLAPEVQDMIVQESEMYLEKLEECEELKEKVDDIETKMVRIQRELDAMKLEKQEQETAARRAALDAKAQTAMEKAATSGMAGLTGKKKGPAETVEVLKQGALEKLSGAKKREEGKKEKKEKWQKRWFVLSSEEDVDGDGIPDLGMYYYKSQADFVKRKKPLGYVVLVNVTVTVVQRELPGKDAGNEKAYNAGQPYQTLKISSPSHDIVLRDDLDDDEDIDFETWKTAVEQIIHMQDEGLGDPRSLAAMGGGGFDEDEDDDAKSQAGSAGGTSTTSATTGGAYGALPPPPTRAASIAVGESASSPALAKSPAAMGAAGAGAGGGGGGDNLSAVLAQEQAAVDYPEEATVM